VGSRHIYARHDNRTAVLFKAGFKSFLESERGEKVGGDPATARLKTNTNATRERGNMLLQLPFSLVTIRACAICSRLFAPRDVYDVQNQTPFIVKLGFIENVTTVEGKKLYARQ